MTVFRFQWGHKKRWRGEEIEIKWADAAPRSPPTSEVEEMWEKTEAKNGRRRPESTNFDLKRPSGPFVSSYTI